MESNALALGVFWSPTLWFWSPNLQIWAFFGVQRFSFGFGVQNKIDKNIFKCLILKQFLRN
ncbi:MAG: hypothetical protein KAI83_08210 [Thiomargarita sp.]|nr:hypothetical protein [Thiomargarita sp.]